MLNDGDELGKACPDDSLLYKPKQELEATLLVGTELSFLATPHNMTVSDIGRKDIENMVQLMDGKDRQQKVEGPEKPTHTFVKLSQYATQNLIQG